MQAMYIFVDGGYASSDFTMTVVTAHGTTYMLQVEDMNKFLAFGANMLTGGKDFYFQHLYKLYVQPANSVNTNEQNFLRLLNQVDSGLTLFRGNVSDFSSWSRLGLNNETNTIVIDCE